MHTCVQGCVRQLSNAQVDRLLAYLDKWAQLYVGGPLAQMATGDLRSLGLPPMLAQPSFWQVGARQR
jgi:hypothetical protein